MVDLWEWSSVFSQKIYFDFTGPYLDHVFLNVMDTQIKMDEGTPNGLH